MLHHVKGKRLLFLSGGILMCQAVSKAKALGIYTIVTDYYHDTKCSPAKEIADESWDISWNDIDALERSCRERGVDGVFTGFSDFCVVSARQLCDRMGFPFYATMEQIEITRNKTEFKKLCEKFEIPTVKQYAVYTTSPGALELADIDYPVLVKPSDNAGSRGISICYCQSDLLKAIEKALGYSESRQVIVERYMTCDEVNVSYTVQEGVFSLSCMSDTQPGVEKHGTIRLSDGWLFPSKHLKRYKEKLDDKVKNMLQSIGIKNGLVFISAFADEEDIYAVECGYRLVGGTTYNFVEANNGINYLEMMIRHAVTGKMEGWDVTEFDNPDFHLKCCNLAIICRPGIIAALDGLDKVKELQGVLSVDPFYNTGDEVPASGAMNQTLVRISIVASGARQLAEIIRDIYEKVTVFDRNGMDMIESKLNIQKIANYWDD